MLRDRYPTPTAGDLIAATRGGKMFSKIDLHSGFHQLKIRASDCHKTAFTTPFGLYEFVSAPFGLANTPGCFQRFMNHVLRKQIADGTVVVYCDDVCIFTKTTCPLEHMAAVEEVLAALREHQLLAKGSKCQFFLIRWTSWGSWCQRMVYLLRCPRSKLFDSWSHQVQLESCAVS